MKNGRVGKEITLVATLYTHEFNAYIFFMLVYRSGRPNLYLAPLYSTRLLKECTVNDKSKLEASFIRSVYKFIMCKIKFLIYFF